VSDVTHSNKRFKVTVPINVDFERVYCLLTTAFEGGSNYWYKVVKYVAPNDKDLYWDDEDKSELYRRMQYPLSKGGAVILTTSQGDKKHYQLDLETLERGLLVMATNYRRHFDDMINEQDDADTGDVFLQCCLFGELVYG